MYNAFLDNMIPIFRNSAFRELLLARYIVIHLVATDAPTSDPFLASLLGDDVDSGILDSWWHITLFVGSPKNCSFRRFYLDTSRVEEIFVEGEIKVKASVLCLD